MQINKMLTLSMDHIRQSTHKFLQLDIAEDKYSSLEVVKDGDDRYFIFINAQDFETYTKFHGDIHIPNDLEVVIKFAIDMECDVLALDKKAKTLPYLPRYEYDDMYGGDMALVDMEKCYLGDHLLSSKDLHGTDDIVLMPNKPETRKASDFFKKQ